MFRSIKETVEEMLNGDKFSDIYEKGNILNCWQQNVGTLINKKTTKKSFKNGILIIKAKTPVWRNELLFQKEEILKKLNSTLEKNKIKDIRFL